MARLALDLGTVDLIEGVLARHDGVRVVLGERERELLAYLCAREGQIATRDELLVRVFGYRAGAPTRVVDDTVKRLRAKIEPDRDRPRHLLTARGQGYRLVAAPPPDGPRALGPGWRLEPGALFHPGGRISLAPAEHRLIEVLAAAEGGVVPREALALAAGAAPSGRAVDHRLSRLGRKLAEASLPPLESVRGAGVRWPLAPRPPESDPEEGPFVGREALLQQIRGAIAPGEVVTLCGPGGVGKSRLARELVRTLQGDVVWCDCAPAEDLGALMDCVLAGLGSVRAPDPERLARALAVRAPRLVVLDDLDAVVEPAAGLLTRLAGAGVALLCTSRERIRLRCERTIEVPPLSEPDGIALFRALVDDGSPPESAAPLVRHLDGLPLAIELAAHQARTLPVGALLAGMSDGLELVGERDRPPRHRSLRAVLGASWGTLDAIERSTLAHCALFRSPFAPEAAVAVAGDRGAWRALSTLVDKSLLRRIAGGSRLALLATVRQYALERLDAGESALALDRHARWFSALGWRLFSQSYSGADPEAIAALVDITEDLLLAARSGPPDLRPRAAVIAAHALRRHGAIGSAGALLTEVLSRPTEPEVEAVAACEACAGPAASIELAQRAVRASEAAERWAPLAWLRLGHLRMFSDDLDGAEEALCTAEGRAREIRDTPMLAEILLWQGSLCTAREQFAEANALYRRVGAEPGSGAHARGIARMSLGLDGQSRGIPPAEVVEHCSVALEHLRGTADVYGEARTNGCIALALRALGRVEEARHHVRAAIGLVRGAGDAPALAEFSMMAAVIELLEGEPEAAEQVLGLPAAASPLAEASWRLVEAQVAAASGREAEARRILDGLCAFSSPRCPGFGLLVEVASATLELGAGRPGAPERGLAALEAARGLGFHLSREHVELLQRALARAGRRAPRDQERGPIVTPSPGRTPPSAGTTTGPKASS